MNVKIIIQILIFLLIIVLLFFFIKNTFLKEEKDLIELEIDKNEPVVVNQNDEEISNIIKNLNYKSVDSNGNTYILNSEYGEVTKEDENIVVLKNVTGLIKLKDKSEIKISADFAKYNSANYNTFFYQNVFGLYKDSKIYSDNFDLLLQDNIAKMYNNIKYLDQNLNLNADEISLDLLYGDVYIKMFDEKNKIQVFKK
tara:strand:+ start:1652 stop:2245 length:594 start_codon:yes stop_codon:yes gene_type:complete